MTKLIFDIQITGHHKEYLNHIIAYLSKNSDTGVENIIVVHPDFCIPPDILLSNNNLNVCNIKKTEYNDIFKSNSIVKRALKYLTLVDNLSEKYKVQECILLNLNIVLPGLPFSKLTHYKLSGILFAQFTRLKPSFVYKRLKRKAVLFLGLKRLDRVFVLNDDKSVVKLNSIFRTDKFTYLPDPINTSPKLSKHIVKYDISNYRVKPSQKIFLLFGSISKRKGVLELINSLNYFSKEDAENSFFLIAGKVKKDFLPDLKKSIEDIRVKNKYINIYLDNRFIPDQELFDLIDTSSYILAPYHNVESSSGIVGLAAITNTIIIANEEGLLGDLVRTYNLGTTTKIEPKYLHKKLISVMRSDNPGNYLNEEYIKAHTPELFVKKLITA